MKLYTNTPLLLLLLFGLITGISSCDRNEQVLAEPAKELTGTWKVSQVLRNTTDITQWIDTESFRLTLQEDESYTIEGNNIPFVVNSGGNWAVDDPLYPFNLSFTPADNGGDAISTEISTTVMKGQRSLNVNFSPGCGANKYVYVFEKVN